jgi:transglutaminase-like putative cysteine protease
MRRGQRTAYQTVAAITLIVGLLIVSLYAFLADVTNANFPEAPGATVYKGSGVVIDASNASDGYLMVKASNKNKLKMRIVKGSATYTYDLNQGDYETFPLQSGGGTYQVTVFRRVKGSQYAQLYSKKIKADMSDEFGFALYPNQYVHYSATSAAVQKSQELCAALTSDADKVKAVIDFVSGTVLYDHIKARIVESGYLPDVDETLSSKKGICFDYAALVACMLRVQGVQCTLVIGYADTYYHAWNNVLVDGKWVLYDTTSMATGLKVVTYTDERVY